MSRKFIAKQLKQNFVYPNNDIYEYETDIVHNINNNVVSGSVINFSATTVNSTGITFTYTYNWNLNGGDRFLTQASETSILSVHTMKPTELYYKPFRMVDNVLSPSTVITTTGATETFTMLPSQLGLTSLTNGTYYFEFRLISKKAVVPICKTIVISTVPAPSPTPTSTPSTPTPTPTPTLTSTPLSYFSGATLNVTDPGYIKYRTPTGDTYQFITTTGTYTVTDCALCFSFQPGFPFADLAAFTVINCGTLCSGPAPTPPPSQTPLPDYYYRLTRCDDSQIYWSQAYPGGTFSSGDRVEGGSGVYYVISGSQTTNPGGTLLTVTDTGLTGCP